jgi:hypothetical protein
MPRFVVLYHEMPAGDRHQSHFDLMLERGAVLRTFTLPRWPASSESVPCEPLADHRLAYLSYEGPISGNRGQVTRHDSGEYDLITDSPGKLVLSLRGQRLRGTLTLERQPANSAAWVASWLAAEAE